MGLIKTNIHNAPLSNRLKNYVSRGADEIAAVSGVVKGKRVVMIDDSIVRGSTSSHRSAFWKEAGASEVHVAIGSPALAYPCFYGIDIQTRQELIMSAQSYKETCQIIGADSLTHLSIDDG